MDCGGSRPGVRRLAVCHTTLACACWWPLTALALAASTTQPGAACMQAPACATHQRACAASPPAKQQHRAAQQQSQDLSSQLASLAARLADVRGQVQRLQQQRLTQAQAALSGAQIEHSGLDKELQRWRSEWVGLRRCGSALSCMHAHAHSLRRNCCACSVTLNTPCAAHPHDRTPGPRPWRPVWLSCPRNMRV
jgi:hypothetical protein